MKIKRKRGRDEFAVFVVGAILIGFFWVLFGIFWLASHHGANAHVTQTNNQRMSVTVFCPGPSQGLVPDPGGNGFLPPITNGKG